MATSCCKIQRQKKLEKSREEMEKIILYWQHHSLERCQVHLNVEAFGGRLDMMKAFPGTACCHRTMLYSQCTSLLYLKIISRPFGFSLRLCPKYTLQRLAFVFILSVRRCSVGYSGLSSCHLGNRVQQRQATQPGSTSYTEGSSKSWAFKYSGS